MVRETLGEDAIIVATREEQGGKSVRVTAAIEPAFELGRGGAASEDWLQYDDEEEQSAVAEEITDVMLRHAVPEDVMDQILSCATVIGLDQPGIALIAALEHLYHYRPLPQKPSSKAMMLVGPPGAGKTLAVAKIAARGAMAGMKIGVITCDTVRAGGVEQLAAFTKILNIDLKKAAGPDELARALSAMKSMDQILIDTPGVNPFRKEDIRALAALTAPENIEPTLVLAAGTDAEESGDMARAFAAIGAHSLLATRTDIARRLGGLLSAAHYGGLAFSDISNTSKVADGLAPVTPKSLARMLMPAAFQGAGTHQPQNTAPQKPAKQRASQ